MTTRRHPTIRDIAAAAGASKSLVSRALRGDADVAPARREAVLRIARELGYRPNLAARALVQRRSHVVGILVSDLHNPFFVELLDGVFDEARLHGFRPLIAVGGRDPAAEQDAIEGLIDLRPDGIMLAGPLVPSRAVASARERVPVVVLAHDPRISGIDIVVNDDELGAALAVEHLVSLGHADIAAIAGPATPSARARVRGYRLTMCARGLSAHVRVVDGDFTEEGGRRGAITLAEGPQVPTAILAPNDLAAVGALHALDEAGLDVPEDVSLVGYDNTSIAGLRHVSLTTIDQPKHELGVTAMRRLIERLADHGDRGTRTVLEPTLVVRRTTAPPRRGAGEVTSRSTALPSRSRR